MRLLRAFSGIFLALAGATLLAMWAVFVSMDFAFGGGLPPPPSTLRDLTDFGGDYAGAYLLLLLADMLILLSVRVGPTRKSMLQRKILHAKIGWNRIGAAA